MQNSNPINLRLTSSYSKRVLNNKRKTIFWIRALIHNILYALHHLSWLYRPRRSLLSRLRMFEKSEVNVCDWIDAGMSYGFRAVEKSIVLWGLVCSIEGSLFYSDKSLAFALNLLYFFLALVIMAVYLISLKHSDGLFSLMNKNANSSLLIISSTSLMSVDSAPFLICYLLVRYFL